MAIAEADFGGRHPRFMNMPMRSGNYRPPAGGASKKEIPCLPLCDVRRTVARAQGGVRSTSGFTSMSPPGAPGDRGEARGVVLSNQHLGP